MSQNTSLQNTSLAPVVTKPDTTEQGKVQPEEKMSQNTSLAPVETEQDTTEQGKVQPEKKMTKKRTRRRNKFKFASDYFEAYNKRSKIWLKSASRANLIQRLEEYTPAGGYQITKAVCLAIANLRRIVCMQQLVVFMDMVNFLEQSNGGGGGADESDSRTITIYAQDPRFQEIEKEFLREYLGMTILELPSAERMIRQGVFSFVPVWNLEYQLLARAPGLQPTLHVGRDPWIIAHWFGIHREACMPEEDDDSLTEYALKLKEQLNNQEFWMDELPGRYFSPELDSEQRFWSLDGLTIYIKEEVRSEDVWSGDVPDSELLNLQHDDRICPCCLPPRLEPRTETASQAEGSGKMQKATAGLEPV